MPAALVKGCNFMTIQLLLLLLNGLVLHKHRWAALVSVKEEHVLVVVWKMFC